MSFFFPAGVMQFLKIFVCNLFFLTRGAHLCTQIFLRHLPIYYLHIMCLSKLIVIVLPQLYKKKLFCSYIILSCCSCIYAGFSVLFSYATLSVYFFQCTLSRPSYCTPSVQYYTLLFLMYSVTPIVLQPVNTGICVYFFSSPLAVVWGEEGGILAWMPNGLVENRRNLSYCPWG